LAAAAWDGEILDPALIQGDVDSGVLLALANQYS